MHGLMGMCTRHACNVMVLAVKFGNCARLTRNWLLQYLPTDKLIDNVKTWLQNEMSYAGHGDCSHTSLKPACEWAIR